MKFNMRKKHEIIELVVKIVCDYFEIKDWKVLCKQRAYGKEMHAKYVCSFLLSKYLKVPVISIGDYFKVGIGSHQLRSNSSRVLYEISDSALPYHDAIQKLSFLIENDKLSKKDSYIVRPSEMIKRYNLN